MMDSMDLIDAEVDRREEDALAQWREEVEDSPFDRCADLEDLRGCSHMADMIWQALHGKPPPALRHRLRAEKSERKHKRRKALKFRRLMQDEAA